MPSSTPLHIDRFFWRGKIVVILAICCDLRAYRPLLASLIIVPCFAEALTAPPPRVVFEHALTESGFLGLARDLDLLSLPFATHTGLVSLFRQNARNLTKRRVDMVLGAGVSYPC